MNLQELLNEWRLDFIASQQIGLVNNELSIQNELTMQVINFPESKEAKKNLADLLEKEFIDNIGAMPGKHIELVDIGLGINFDFSILKEKHRVYWLLKEELEK